MRILIIEDSVRLAHAMRVGLQHEGFAVDVVHEGPRGLAQARANPYDLLILDVMLPDLDGLSVLRQLRASGSDVHVLMLSARDAPNDIAAALDAGADDYLAKPFDWPVLCARLRAIGRRRFGGKNPFLTLGALRLDPAGRTAALAGARLYLTPREFGVLERLLRLRGRPASREALEDALYDRYTLPEGNAIPTIVCRLRAKLDAHPGAPRIVTQRGHGYILEST